MNIAFFVSDHGFGHIMRELPVIKYMFEKGHNITLVCGYKHIELAEKQLGKNINYVRMHTDVGVVVKHGTILRDDNATAAAVKDIISEYPQRIMYAKRVLLENKIDKVVADIVPWVLRAAKELCVPTYLMVSFTWLDQYGECIPTEHRELLEESFKMAENILYYDLANKPSRELLGEGVGVGFVSRLFSEVAINKIRQQHKRKIVFLSLGASNTSLDFDIVVGHLNYDFITTSALRLVGDNVTYLDIDVENTQDYIKAADYCITKPGWTTVAEIMVAGTPCGLLTRPGIVEDTLTIQEMVSRGAAISIDVEELKNMGYVLEKMEKYPWRNIQYPNSYKKIADIILH